jgi:LPPG:FO 2-phospho-L-lactate transferase
MSLHHHVVLLAGGVGGAKLAVGLAGTLPPEALTVIVNTGDDLEHLGLSVSPDVDTVMYSLAGLANPQTGWGVDGDTFQVMEMVSRYGGPDWFRLGDRDLGTHVMRTFWLGQGERLTVITRWLCEALGVRPSVLPMTDGRVRTMVETDMGWLSFQEYFVREKWQPAVHRLRYEGAETAHPSPEVEAALQSATLVVFGPSNPFLSIDPILAVAGIRALLESSPAPCVAVSPIVSGQALKGPAARLMAGFGVEVSPVGIAKHYRNLVDGIILDTTDAGLISRVEQMGIKASAQQTVMNTLADKTALAQSLLKWVEETGL